MKKVTQVTGKLLYGATFLILIPGGLLLWARNTNDIISFPVIESKSVGWALILIGSFLILWAMFVLTKFGKGLPMNAYPPSRFVTNGPYRLFRHPIYWGFGLLMIGYFLLIGSGSGIWLVSPVTIIAMIALVLGHESIDLKRRFPNQNIRTILDYPENKTSSPDLRDRLTSLFWVVSGLIISNFLIEKLNGNIPPLFGEPLHIFPNLENTWLPLLSMLFLFVTTLMLKRKDDLREWEISGFIGLGYAAFIALLFPAFGAQYFPAKDSTLFAVPIFLILISLRGLYKQSRLAAVIFTIIAAIVIIIQLANSRSAVLHGIVSVLIFLLSAYYLSIWIFLKNTAEKIANSWVEWTFGKVRVLNRGFYTGPGVFFTILVAGILAGKDYGLAIMICAILLIICAGLWAQIIEGSEKLKRPFGYYGGLYGLLIASVFVWLMGLNMWVVLGTSSVVMTWGQAIGRLGCLVNGCCHGGRTDNSIIGIRYFHPRSRVSIISGLKGELVHPTQLYSIIWLFFVGIFLFALWMNHHSYSFIFGIYLILTSLGRFVEEAYRGEKQTLIIKGLRLYQWIAMITFIIGIVMTLIKINPVVISPGLYWETICYATIGGLFAFFAMGVDFPYSNARFSRLV